MTYIIYEIICGDDLTYDYKFLGYIFSSDTNRDKLIDIAIDKWGSKEFIIETKEILLKIPGL